jgi:hypothetical protein
VEWETDALTTLIHRIQEDKEACSKEKALDLLFNYYKWVAKDEIREEKFPKETYGYNQNKLFWEYEETEECKEKIEKWFDTDGWKQEQYREKKKQIEEAEVVYTSMIWDTNGGLLNWAIRNGFLEENCPDNTVLCWNIG